MKTYSLSHLSDPVLLRDLAALVSRDRTTTAALLAHIAEVDARKLYLPAAFPSMFAYCVQELRLSEDTAFKRIKAARAARRFPAVFAALAAGRLHLSAVVLLAPHLTEDTADELLGAATHRSKSEIEQLLAQRFPRPDVLAWVEAIPASSVSRSVGQQAPGPVEDRLAPGRVGEELPHAPGPAGGRSSVKPLSPQSFAVQFTLSQRGHAQLLHAQELLGHQIPSGDIAQVFERALDALIGQLEQRKFAATARPRSGGRRSTRSTRHVPAHVRRTVWERDGGQCTFGPEFMRHKRQAATEDRAVAKLRTAAAARAQATAAAQALVETPGEDEDRDVVPWLRQLGFNASEARRAAARCEDIPDASLEQRLRVALSCFRKRSTRVGRAGEESETAAAFAGAAPAG